jgi:hypothetical protein
MQIGLQGVLQSCSDNSHSFSRQMVSKKRRGNIQGEWDVRQLLPLSDQDAVDDAASRLAKITCPTGR